MSNLLESAHVAAVAALAAIPMDADAYGLLDDATLLEIVGLAGQLRVAADTRVALAAGEIDRRSAPELGHTGLAQSTGHRTPEELVRVTTGTTKLDAGKAVRVGRLAHGDEQRPWLAPVGAALVDDGRSAACADAIGSGLGKPSLAVTADELAAAAQRLCAEAAMLDPDRLYRRARDLRDELDEAGIASREECRRDERSLRFFKRANGMSRLIWEMDPETAAQVGELYDRATSPKLQGPRFVSPEDAALIDRILSDPRTSEQLASDTFVQLLRSGADADSSQLLGTGAPSVRVLVTEQALREREGHGRIEGQSGAISMATIERLSCGGAIIPIAFDQGQPLDVGREQRLYTRRQRIALAARDGGCRWPGCDRPASWTEAHHTKHWLRDGGRTDTADGILLCRHHHLLAHNDHWEIERDGGDYWLVAPEGSGIPRQLMPTKSDAMRDLARERDGGRPRTTRRLGETRPHAQPPPGSRQPAGQST